MKEGSHSLGAQVSPDMQLERQPPHWPPLDPGRLLFLLLGQRRREGEAQKHPLFPALSLSSHHFLKVRHKDKVILSLKSEKANLWFLSVKKG